MLVIGLVAETSSSVFEPYPALKSRGLFPRRDLPQFAQNDGVAGVAVGGDADDAVWAEDHDGGDVMNAVAGRDAAPAVEQDGERDRAAGAAGELGEPGAVHADGDEAEVDFLLLV